MQGQRRNDVIQDAEGWSRPPEAVQPGDYWKLVHNDGSVEWYAHVPSGETGSLAGHEVTEHEDGTITVSPSILTAGERVWHGYLERGVWREV
jgi:hypothetical protein